MKEVEETEKTIKDFPSTRYQGSKRKILGWLYENLKDLEFKSVLDAFGGTSAVSYMFKLMGKAVTYNDELYFNFTIGKALIENDSVILSEKEIDSILDVSEVEYTDEFIQRNFEDIYYTKEENIWIDKYLSRLSSNQVFDGTYKELEFKKSIALYGLFQAALTKRPYNLFHRKNLYMRTSDVKRNFGNKVTWEKTFEEQIRKFIKEANNSIFVGEHRCNALNCNAFDIKNEGYDLVYIDPPYVDKNGDHDTMDYLYCYHFLEGVSRRHEWKELIDFETKNLRFKKDLHSNYFKRKNVLESFESLFSTFQDSAIVVSYKKNGIPSIEEIEILMRKFKKRIIKQDMHYIYALNKQNGNKRENREVLLIGLS